MHWESTGNIFRLYCSKSIDVPKQILRIIRLRTMIMFKRAMELWVHGHCNSDITLYHECIPQNRNWALHWTHTCGLEMAVECRAQVTCDMAGEARL